MSDARWKSQAGLLPIATDGALGSALAPTTCPPRTTPPEEPPNVTERWHPKVTPYRFLITALVICLGTAKALTASAGGGLATSVTLEWISGIIVLLLTFFLTRYEAKEHATPAWFFKTDLIARVRRAGIGIPQYDTDERPLELVVRHAKLPVTGYRILVSAAAVSFGSVKATLSYTGYGAAPKAVDWVYGVIVTVVLYWMGIYENALTEPPITPWLFTKDYAKQVYVPSFVVGSIVKHLVALWTMHLFSVFCFSWANALAQPEGNKPALAHLFHLASLYGYLITLYGFGIGLGVVSSCVIVGSLGLRTLQWLLLFVTACRRAWRRLFVQPVSNGINEEAAPALESTAYEFTISTGLWAFLFSAAPSGKWRKVARVLAALSIVSITTQYLIVHKAGCEGYVLSFGWILLWFLLMWTLWPWFISTDGLGAECGFVMVTVSFTQIGYIAAVLVFAAPILAVLGIVSLIV